MISMSIIDQNAILQLTVPRYNLPRYLYMLVEQHEGTSRLFLSDNVMQTVAAYERSMDITSCQWHMQPTIRHDLNYISLSTVVLTRHNCQL